MKKHIITVVSAVSLLLLASCASSKTVTESVPEAPAAVIIEESAADYPVTIQDIPAIDFVKNMKTGWNLGNTFDAPTETGWGQPMTTKGMITALAESGIKTIRIPVSWSRHMNRKTNIINAAWLKRVKEVVDWAIEADMYVIINSHHDNYNDPKEMPVLMGYYPNTVNCEKSIQFLTAVWTQVAAEFRDYDEHLIFETMNEPRPVGTNYEWWYDQNAAICRDASATLNKLNQAALNAIRATGGNNTKRFVMIPGLRAAVSSVTHNSFIMPSDSAEDKLIISVHMYDPQDFAMNAPGSKKFTERHKSELASTFTRLNTQYVSKGIPVVIGEYGATNKGNQEDRLAWFDYFLSEGRKLGMCAVLWDNSSYLPNPNEGEHFGYFNRSGRKWYDPAIIEKIQEVMAREEN